MQRRLVCFAVRRLSFLPDGSRSTGIHDVLSAATESLPLGYCARRHVRVISAVARFQETAKDRTKQEPRGKSKFNVHDYVVKQKMPLEDVLPLVQHQVQTKTLKTAVARHAVDSFYFHCAQQAERKQLTEDFRRKVLHYFDHELFPTQEEAAAPGAGGDALNEAVFGSILKLHLEGGDTEAAWMLINKLRRNVTRKTRTSTDGKQKLHFRTVRPLLEHECRHGMFPSAYSRWQELKHGDVEWTRAMEDVLVQMVIACVRHHDVEPTKRKTLPENFDASGLLFHTRMTSLLHDLQLTCREVSPANAKVLAHAFQEAGYSVKPVPSDGHMRVQCPCCGHVLNKQTMTRAERDHMSTAIESRRSKVSPRKPVKEYLQPFRDWLMLRHAKFVLQGLAANKKKREQRLHYVLDGPNIAYINQNFEAGTYRLDQVDAVARVLQTQGHLVSITMPTAYLADKFVVRIRSKLHKQMRRQGKIFTRERTSEEKAILARWHDEDMLYSCRTNYLSDDLFWLYASVLLGEEGRVVTNDQGRDHVCALLNGYVRTCARAPTRTKGQRDGKDAMAPSLRSMDLVSRWKEMTTVNLELKHEDTAALREEERKRIESIQLVHPPPFSRVPQVTAPWHFHFPIADQVDPPKPSNDVQHVRKRTRWLCVHRTDAVSQVEKLESE